MLRLVVLETSAACVQLAQDFTAADVGLAVLDPSKAVQVCVGGCAQGPACTPALLHQRMHAQALRSPSCLALAPALPLEAA